METDDLILAIGSPLAGELRETCIAVLAHCNGLRAKGHSTDCSTSLEDSALLYLLVRHFRRARIFESGTNIGTTALALSLAANRNDGVLTTCDPVDYGALLPLRGMRFIHAPAQVALSILESEGQKVDFIFFDWLPDDPTLAVLSRICADDVIFATHDYGPNLKGEMTVAALTAQGLPKKGSWFFPGPKPVKVDDIAVNICTAFFIPDRLMA